MSYDKTKMQNPVKAGEEILRADTHTWPALLLLSVNPQPPLTSPPSTKYLRYTIYTLILLPLNQICEIHTIYTLDIFGS